MSEFLSAPETAAQRQRDLLLGVLVGLARATFSELKTEDTDRVLAEGLQLAADPDAGEEALLQMTRAAAGEKLRVAPNCASCAMPCGNTANYDLSRLWTAPEEIRTLKLRLLSALFVLAGRKNNRRNPEGDLRRPVCPGRGLGGGRVAPPSCSGPRRCAGSDFSGNRSWILS